MKCPYCGKNDTKVVDTRQRQFGRVRRRECEQCGKRFATTEIIGAHNTDLPLLPTMVQKKDGTLEPFNRRKLHNSIAYAIRKPNRDNEKIDEFAHRLEQEAMLSDGDMPTVEIGARVLSWLRHSDAMGYLRYASVYKELNSPNDFIELVKYLKQ